MSVHPSLKSNLQAIIDGKSVVPISKLIGFNMTSFEYGKAIFEMRANPKHHNPMGTIHGGVYCDIADAAMGLAFYSTLQEGESFGTINFQINFLKTLRETALRAEGYLVKKGRSIAFLEAKIFDSEDELVATAQSTCKIFSPKK